EYEIQEEEESGFNPAKSTHIRRWLQCHLETHLNLKSYQCDFCPSHCKYPGRRNYYVMEQHWDDLVARKLLEGA
ncbi:hypothetical protein X801_03787, partial [Opisthorchis viverrini]